MNHDGSISTLLNPVNRINALMERHRKELEEQPGSQIKMDLKNN